MRYVKPAFYDSFRCTADKCPDTCCAGWQIMIDEESLEKYAKDVDDAESGAFAKRLRNSVDWKEGCFHQYSGRCAMLNDQNLCDLVIEKGEDWLCSTCDRYPRHIEEFDGIREMSLSLSCPVAAEMILQEEALTFLTEEDEEQDPLEDEFEDFDFLLFTQLEDARNKMFRIVQDRKMPVRLRMRAVLELAGRLQVCLDEERLFDMEEEIRNFTAEVKPDEDSRERFERIKENFQVLEDLERLRPDWSAVLSDAKKTLYSKDYTAYEMIYRGFEDSAELGPGFTRKQWDICMEQILMFFLYTYFCGAVYDDCIYSKAALAVFSACYIQELVMCRRVLSGGQISPAECRKLAYRYAREVEHSDDNIIALEEYFLENMLS